MGLKEQRARVRERGATVRQTMGAQAIALKDAKGSGKEWRLDATVTGVGSRLGELVEGGVETSGEARVRWWKVRPSDSEENAVPEEGMVMRMELAPGRTWEVVEVSDSLDAKEWVVRVRVVR